MKKLTLTLLFSLLPLTTYAQAIIVKPSGGGGSGGAGSGTVNGGAIGDIYCNSGGSTATGPCETGSLTYDSTNHRVVANQGKFLGLLFNVCAKTGAYTLGVNDSFCTGDTTGGTFAFTLPTAVGITGRVYTVKKIDSSTNILTLATTSSQTIDGVTTQSIITQYSGLSVISDGANWKIISSAGVAFADPGADKIIYFRESDKSFQPVTISTGLSFSSGTLTATGSGSGTVTTTGTPANGNLAKFSAATSITNADLTGDVTTSGGVATTIATGAVTNSKIANSTIDLTAKVTGILPAANGGTGQNSLTGLALPQPIVSWDQVTLTTTGNITKFSTICDVSGGAFTATLPTAVGKTGQLFVIQTKTTSANACTIATTSSQTLNGGTSYLLYNGGITVISDGTNWQLVAAFNNPISFSADGGLRWDNTNKVFINGDLKGDTSAIGGAITTSGCDTGTVTITGAAVGMTVVATPDSDPGVVWWGGYVSSSNTITVKVCADATVTPTSVVYHVRVLR